MKVVHVITGLGTGGANTMLLRLLEAGLRHGLAGQPEVVSLTGRGALGDAVEALGVPLHCLDARHPALSPVYLARLVAILRRARPDLVQGWMVHGNLAATFGTLLGWRSRRPPVLWNIRQSFYDPSHETPLTARLIRLAARWSRRPAAILYNSQVACRHHVAIGYDVSRALVVPNGFDTEWLRPDPEARRSVRHELDLAETVPLVGLVGRYHPVKDHAGFVSAMARVAEQHPDLHLLLVGPGVTPEQPELVRQLETAGLLSRTRLLGPRPDVARLDAALDVAVCSSYTEAFANVVAEAMACGVPCAVTDVGESAIIVGDTGEVVPPQDPKALAAAVSRLLALPIEDRRELGRRARRRIVETYSLEG
ncbi:MAG: glycosyltransferase, partial [Acidobacteria bacterium]|nr:glycosyltransferase [Acidobacteriota bacterium]